MNYIKGNESDIHDIIRKNTTDENCFQIKEIYSTSSSNQNSSNTVIIST